MPDGDIDKTPIGLVSRFKSSLKKTTDHISSIFTGNRIDESFWQDIEEQLIMADVGAEVTAILLDRVRNNHDAVKTPQTLLTTLKREAIRLFPSNNTVPTNSSKPYVLLVIGVNGVGKTTTIAKIAKIHKERGERVVLGAADTFRAAAVNQLKSWSERLGVEFISRPDGSDPASVAFEAVDTGLKTTADLVIVDTAGRLHTKHNLTEELKKIHRVMSKAKADAPNEVLLVLDGTTGQNALAQARAFNVAVPITALAITKLDGTAKGGVVLRIASELKIPVKYVGLGEDADDLVKFDAEAYIEALFSM